MDHDQRDFNLHHQSSYGCGFAFFGVLIAMVFCQQLGWPGILLALPIGAIVGMVIGLIVAKLLELKTKDPTE